MAAVYEARDMRLDRAVALKILPAEFLHDQTFARRFETEARLIARLEHRNIVPIYASGIDEGIPWMSMRLLEGNLGILLEQRRLETSETVRLLQQVAAALDHAHALGIVHRDIKPANILLDASGAACVADFGLAHLMGAGRLTQTGVLAGTPHYMAPEQALGKPLDHRCDIYSLGIVAYEMLAGTIPFTAPSPVAVLLQHVHDALPPPPDRWPPPPWMDAIRKAAAKDPGDRWASAGAFVDALGRSIGAVPPHGEHANDGVLRRASRSKAVWSAVAGVALVVLGLVWVRDRPPAARPADGAAAAAPAGPVPDAAVAGVPAPRAQVTSPVPPSASAAPHTRGSTAPDAKPRVSRRSQNSATPPPPAVSAAAAAPPQSAPDAAAPVPPQPSGASPATADIPIARDPITGVPGIAAPAPRVEDIFTDVQLIREVKPAYPQAAVAAELEGEVTLEGVVGVDGRIREVTVVRSVHPLLDAAARKAWQQHEYRPARRNGRPEPVKIQKKFQFILKEPAAL